MMTKTDSTRPVQDDLFRVMLRDLVVKNAPYKRKNVLRSTPYLRVVIVFGGL